MLPQSPHTANLLGWHILLTQAPRLVRLSVEHGIDHLSLHLATSLGLTDVDVVHKTEELIGLVCMSKVVVSMLEC